MDSGPGQGRPVICNHCRHVNPPGSTRCELCWEPITEEVRFGAGAASFSQPGGYPGPYYEPVKSAPPSRAIITIALIGVFVFLTPILIAAGSFAGCIAGVVVAGDKGMMLMIPGAVLGLAATIWIMIMMGRSMYRR